MILTATLTDSLGRRPLTVYPYAVTSLSVLCLGIMGCIDYTKPAASAALVSIIIISTLNWTIKLMQVRSLCKGVFCVLGYLQHDWSLCNWVCVCSGNPPAASTSADRRLRPSGLQHGCHHIQLLHTAHDQWTSYEMGRQDGVLVSCILHLRTSCPE